MRCQYSSVQAGRTHGGVHGVGSASGAWVQRCELREECDGQRPCTAPPHSQGFISPDTLRDRS